MDSTTKFLFKDMPREVGRTRKRVWNIHQIQEYIDKNNGYTDCFISVYSLNFRICSIFYDFDDKLPEVNVLDLTKKLAKFFEAEGFPYIPIVSGKKGYHMYQLFRPKRYEKTKQLLKAVTFKILNEVYGQSLNKLISYEVIDPHLIGNIKALCRIPNTLRPPENLTYCTYLPPEEFLDMTEEDISFHMKSTHVYNYHLNPIKAPTLDDFDVDLEEYKTYKNNKRFVFNALNNNSSLEHVKNVKTFLKPILRPCLFTQITKPNPRHCVRLATTVDLLQFYTPEQILQIYAKLGWIDFDKEISMKKINSCTYLHPYSCKRLRELRIPTLCCER